jgi:plastocyanin
MGWQRHHGSCMQHASIGQKKARPRAAFHDQAQESTVRKMYGTVFTTYIQGVALMKRLFCLFAALTILFPPAFSADYLVDQKDKQFSKKSMKVKVGDVIEFRNSDPFAHNIFSLSDTKSFDLGSYAQGQSKKVTFDKPGKVEVECSIHPSMQMEIEVEK